MEAVDVHALPNYSREAVGSKRRPLRNAKHFLPRPDVGEEPQGRETGEEDRGRDVGGNEEEPESEPSPVPQEMRLAA